MRLKLPLLVLLSLLGVLQLSAQSDVDVQPPDALELKAGRVVNGHAVSFGVAAKLYTSPRIAWTQEVTLLGGPNVGMTISYDIPLTDNLRFTPHLGAGMPLLPVTAIGIAGFDVSYAVDSDVRFFVDARIYSFTSDLVSRYGSGIYEVRDLRSKSPVVLSAGVSF